MALVVPLRQRGAWTAAIALLPIPAAVRRWRILRRRAYLTVGDDALTIGYPEGLKAPLVVPRDTVRVVAVDDRGRYRFRAGEGYLWSRGQSALPRLTPEGVPPNVLLLFDPPVAGARTRGGGLRGIYRGERLAGVLLAAHDAGYAARVLDRLGVTRPITMPDVIALEEHQNAPDGGRFVLGRRRTLQTAWALIAIGVILPILAAVAAVIGAIVFASGRRAHGVVLGVVGLGVFGARLALWLG